MPLGHVPDRSKEAPQGFLILKLKAKLRGPRGTFHVPDRSKIALDSFATKI